MNLLTHIKYLTTVHFMQPLFGRSQSWDLKFFFWAAILLAAYVVLGRLSFNYLTHPFVPLVWPPSGLALAAVALGGYRFVPVAIIGSFLTDLMVHESIGIAVGVALGVGVAMVMGRFLLDHWNFNPLLFRLSDMLALVFAAVLVGLILAITSTLTLFAGHYVFAGAEFNHVWTTRWISDTLGMIVFAPFIIRWLPRPMFHATRSRSELLEFFGSIGALCVLDIVTYGTAVTTFGPLPLLYLTLVPFMMIALRVGPRGMTLAVMLNGCIAIAGTIITRIPQGISLEELLPIQILVGVISTLFLILVGVEEERKESRLKLQGHIKELQEALQRIDLEDKSKNEFIAILAHELRNPLAPVLSALEYLKLQEPKSERLHMIEGAVEQIQVMRRLLDDLLDVARITQKKFRLKREPLLLEQSINQSVRMVEPFILSRGHKFAVTLPQEMFWLNADSARLTQIFSNLLFNAAKYTEPGGRIELSAKRSDGNVIVSVKDTGIGIAPEMLEKIFEPFVQYSHAAKVGTGLGLGLSLAKRLVEMHGGTIAVYSPGLGKGSEFLVTLPLSQNVNTLKLPMEDSLGTHQARGFRILVVDDNKPAADGLSKLLQLRGGHEIAVAYTGADGIEKAAEFDPMVIILDIGLPDQSGYDVAKRLRSNGYTQKLVALTGFGQDDDKRRAVEAGFNHHLTKPIGFSDIERLLNKFAADAEKDENSKNIVSISAEKA
jgi:signal transduction histidine kinase/ActR/RegA family two-component response regulator